jgi:transcriptional regulator with XRE-family HTH domain
MPASMYALVFYQARAEFGARLRRLRDEAGLNGKQLAGRLGWAASKVSRIETGKQTATPDDVTPWAEVTSAEQALVDDLLADLRTVRFEYATWTRQFRAGTAARQRVSVEIEGTATAMRALETTSYPGCSRPPTTPATCLAPWWQCATFPTMSPTACGYGCDATPRSARPPGRLDSRLGCRRR